MPKVIIVVVVVVVNDGDAYLKRGRKEGRGARAWWIGDKAEGGSADGQGGRKKGGGAERVRVTREEKSKAAGGSGSGGRRRQRQREAAAVENGCTVDVLLRAPPSRVPCPDEPPPLLCYPSGPVRTTTDLLSQHDSIHARREGTGVA